MVKIREAKVWHNNPFYSDEIYAPERKPAVGQPKYNLYDFWPHIWVEEATDIPNPNAEGRYVRWRCKICGVHEYWVFGNASVPANKAALLQPCKKNRKKPLGRPKKQR